MTDNRLTIRLPLGLAQWVQDQAEERGTTPSDVVRQCVTAAQQQGAEENRLAALEARLKAHTTAEVNRLAEELVVEEMD